MSSGKIQAKTLQEIQSVQIILEGLDGGVESK